jgi:hypothetical protein
MKKKQIVSLKDFFKCDRLTSSDEAIALSKVLKSAGIVTLDFSGIDSMEEPFAHELFVTWYQRNPNAILSVIRANERVEAAIGNILRTK